MKFAHIADCHVGCWRQPEMQALNLEAFERAIDKCISEQIDFVLLAGDLFDTALPSVDILKSVASKLRQLKNKNIGCYIIHGSHDFSASGKSMIAVLEKAGLCEDVANKFVELNNAVLFGFAGKKGSLEQQEILDMKNETSEKINALKKEKNVFSILLAHTTISELANLPSQAASISLENLPDGFDYYALGHIHQKSIIEDETGGKTAAYSGALFPANFSELEEQHNFNFFIIEKIDAGKITKQNVRQISESIKPIINITIDATDETPLTLKEKILAEMEKNKDKLEDAVVTLRIAGVLENGKPSAVDFNAVEEQAKNLGVYCLLRNISKLESKEFDLKIDAAAASLKDIQELEQLSLQEAIKEKVIASESKKHVLLLLKQLDLEKVEGETSTTFSSRLTKEIVKALDLEEVWA